ncbi:MAG TPA: site-specific integrase [Longimicrobiales bacterium]|nr:site-specific integrase [Longimicrobiales bacterium]
MRDHKARRTDRTGGITRRGANSWQLQVRIGKRRFRKTVRGSRLEAEDSLLAYRLELKQKLEADIVPGEMRFSDLTAAFRRGVLPELRTDGTRVSYESALGRFERFFTGQLLDPPIDQVRRKHVKAFVRWRGRTRDRGKGPVSAFTVRKDLRVLHRLLAFAVVDLEAIESNPATGVPGPPVDERAPVILAEDQYEDLLDACAERPMLRAYVAVLGETGLRAESEALQLRWDDVDLAARTIHVRSAPGRRTKTGRSRRVPITPSLDGILRDHLARFRFATYHGRRSEHVFHHLTDGRTHRAGDRVKSFRKAFANAAERAGLPEDFRRHDLRHRRATLWIAEGRNPVHVKEALGHANIATTMRYTHLADEHVDALLAPAPNPLRGAAAG